MPDYDDTFLIDCERKRLRSYNPHRRRRFTISQNTPQLVRRSLYEIIENCKSN